MDIAPHMREPLDATADPRIKELHWLWSPGGGKTTGIEGAVQWRFANKPSNVLLIGQKDDTAKRWMETRFIPSVKKNPVLRHLLPTDGARAKTQIRKTTLLLNSGFYFEAGGSAESNLQEKSMPMVIFEEAWKTAEHPGRIQQGKQRTHDKYNALIMYIGQAGPTHLDPDDDDSVTDLYREWQKCDQRVFSFECDKCGTVQPWKWDQVKWDKIRYDPEDDTSPINWDATNDTVHMTCCNGDCDRIWRDTVSDRRHLANSGRYVATNPHARKGHVGFHANALCYWRIPWSKLVAQFHEACEAKATGDLTKLQQFVQQRLCEFWTPHAYEVNHELVAGGYKLADVADGQLIDFEAGRVLTVDVQQNSLWFLATAWTDEGTCKVLDCGEVLTLDEIEQVRQRLKIPPRCTMLDCGYRQDFVFQVCAQRGYTAFKGTGTVESFPVRGGDGKLRRMPYSKPIGVKSGSGANAVVINLCVNPIKDVVADLRAGRAGELLTPDDLGPDFKDHLNSEVRRMMVVGRERRERPMWVRVGKRHNHLLDCLMAATGFAMIKGFVKVDLGDEAEPDAEEA